MGKMANSMLKSHLAIRPWYRQNPWFISSVHVNRLVGQSEQTVDDKSLYPRYRDGPFVFSHWGNIFGIMQEIHSMTEQF